MEPLLKSFHTQFFDSYSKSIPFELLPEDQVVSKDAYKAIVQACFASSGALDISNFAVVIPGCKVLLEKLMGHQNEKEMIKIFNPADGVMLVSTSFKQVKIGLGAMGVVKVEAQTNIALFNKSGDIIFSVDESGSSKDLSPLFSAAPLMTAEKSRCTKVIWMS